MKYTNQNAQNDLKVIEWLRKEGTLSAEDARWMRNHVQTLQSNSTHKPHKTSAEKTSPLTLTTPLGGDEFSVPTPTSI